MGPGNDAQAAMGHGGRVVLAGTIATSAPSPRALVGSVVVNAVDVALSAQGGGVHGCSAVSSDPAMMYVFVLMDVE